MHSRIRMHMRMYAHIHVYVFVCKCALGSSKASQPLNILAYAISSTSASSLRRMPLRLAVGAASVFPGSSALALPLSPPPNGLILLTYPLYLGLRYVHLT